jgi:hypothetical protein
LYFASASGFRPITIPYRVISAPDGNHEHIIITVAHTRRLARRSVPGHLSSNLVQDGLGQDGIYAEEQ